MFSKRGLVTNRSYRNPVNEPGRPEQQRDRGYTTFCSFLFGESVREKSQTGANSTHHNKLHSSTTPGCCLCFTHNYPRRPAWQRDQIWLVNAFWMQNVLVTKVSRGMVVRVKCLLHNLKKAKPLQGYSFCWFVTRDWIPASVPFWGVICHTVPVQMQKWRGHRNVTMETL